MELLELVEIADDKRDTDWENAFFTKLTEGNLEITSEDPQYGPDGWPYLMTQTSAKATEPVQKILHWCSTRGIGLVVNAHKPYPDFVFTFGMIWHFRQTGLFFQPAAQTVSSGQLEIKPDTEVLAGSPSEEYLPASVKKVLRDFLRDQGLLRPRILLMSPDGSGEHYDICFSLESLGNPPEKEHQGIGEAISWFLPPHYSLVLISEKDIPQFIDL